MHSGRNLGQHLPAPLTPDRIDRQWAAIETLSAGPGWSMPRIWGLGLALSAAAVILFVAAAQLRMEPELLTEGAVIAPAAQQQLRLRDGSRVETTDATRLTAAMVRPDRTELRIDEGGATFDVTHVDGRVFAVQAAGVEVIVRGTRFHVDVDEGRVSVAVERGRVEVRASGTSTGGRLLNAGQRWSGTAEQIGPPEEIAPTPKAKEVAKQTETPEQTPASPSAASTTETGEFSALVKAREYKKAYAALGPAGFDRELAQASAKRLLELADAARFSGHPNQAALALDRLRRDFRGNSRAGLAALELGRLRMDSLGNTAGALEAFNDAIALAPSGHVREDAEARRVQTLERMGNHTACQRARDAYLVRYPKGVHSASIRQRCGMR